MMDGMCDFPKHKHVALIFLLHCFRIVTRLLPASRRPLCLFDYVTVDHVFLCRLCPNNYGSLVTLAFYCVLFSALPQFFVLFLPFLVLLYTTLSGFLAVLPSFPSPSLLSPTLPCCASAYPVLTWLTPSCLILRYPSLSCLTSPCPLSHSHCDKAKHSPPISLHHTDTILTYSPLLHCITSHPTPCYDTPQSAVLLHDVKPKYTRYTSTTTHPKHFKLSTVQSYNT